MTYSEAKKVKKKKRNMDGHKLLVIDLFWSASSF